MKYSNRKNSIKLIITVYSLLCLTTICLAGPTISNLDNTTYSEDSPASLVDDNITLVSTDNFTNGYFEIKINEPNHYDNLTITRDDNASIVSGEVTVVGNSIYVGNGVFANSVGIVTIDNGSHFRADFSNTFYNGNFEKAEVNGEIPGWIKILERVYLDNQSILVGLPTPLDITWPYNNSSRNLFDNASISGGFNPTIQVTDNGAERYVQLGTGNSVQMSSGNGYGIIRGPVLYSSSAVSLVENDNISFAWKGIPGGDAYDAYAYLLDIKTGHTVNLLDETDNDTVTDNLFQEKTIRLGSGDNGTYRYVFVAGSFDATGGRRLGGSLGIDNISAESSNTVPLEGFHLKKLMERIRYQFNSDSPPNNRQLLVTIEDDNGDNFTTSSFINIISAEDFPTADNITQTINEDNKTATIQLIGRDGDLDNFSYIITSNAKFGVIDNTSVSFSGNLSYSPYDNLSSRTVYYDNLTYVVVDNKSNQSNISFVFLTILGENDPPTAFDNLSSGNFTENLPDNLTLTGLDIDRDNFTYTILSYPTYGLISNFDNISGSLTFAPYDNLSANQILVDNFTFQTTDNHSDNSTPATIAFQVLGTNDPPIIENMSFVAQHGSEVSQTLSFFDNDLLDSHSLTIVDNSTYGTVFIDNSSLGNITYISNYNSLSLNDKFSVQIKDNNNASDNATVSVKINHPPKKISGDISDSSVFIGELFLKNFIFSDLNTEDNLTAKISGASWLNLSVSGNNPLLLNLSGLPDRAHEGNNPFTLTIQDSIGGQIELVFNIFVQATLLKAIPIETTDKPKAIPPAIQITGENRPGNGNFPKLSSGNSIIISNSKYETQLFGNINEQITMVIVLPISESKSQIEIRATQTLEGTQSIEVNTINPAETPVTSALINLPNGTQTEIQSDGSIKSYFLWDSSQVDAKITPKGKVSIELVSAVMCIDGKPTRVTLPEGSRTTFSQLSLESQIFPELFSRSNIQKTTLKMNKDGKILTKSPLSVGSQTTHSTVPSCTDIEVTYTGALIGSLPSIKVNQQKLSPTITQNFDGEIQVSLEKYDLNNEITAEPILLPKLAKGSTVEIFEDSGSLSFSARMPLYTNTSTTSSSQNRVLITTEKGSQYYLGRDPVTDVAIYIAAMTTDSEILVTRELGEDLSEGLTLIEGIRGTALVYYEKNNGMTEVLETGQKLEIYNGGQRMNLQTGHSHVTFPIEEAISIADLEILARRAHSIWSWDTQNHEWQGYSPFLERNVLIFKELRVPRLNKRIESGHGISIFNKEEITILLPDSPPGDLIRLKENRIGEWHLLGNNTDRPVSISDLLNNLPMEVLALWRLVDGNWQVFTPHSDFEADRQKQNIPEWPLNDSLESGNAYWVQIGKTENSRFLRQPPQF